MASDAVRMRSRVLLRRRWPAAIGLGVVVALGGGLVLALAMIAKDTGSAVETYVAGADAPEGMAIYCSPGRATAEPDPAECMRYDPEREVASLRTRSDVVAVGRAAPSPVFIRPPGKAWTEGFAWVAIDDIRVYGEPDVVTGRLARPGATTEVTVNEGFVRQHGLGVGDHLELAPITWDEYNSSEGFGGDPAGTAVPVEIVGVVRTPADLSAAVEGNDALAVNESELFLGPRWAQVAQPADFARYQNGVVVDVRPGADAAAVLRSAEPGFAGYLSTENLVDSEVGVLSDAVSYEARATWVAAALSAIAVVVFVGQMLARQARRELDDAPALRAIGASTGMLVRSAVPRWAVSTVLAVAGAAVIGAVGRGRGPVGVARRMLGPADVGLDPLLAPTVLLAIAALVLGVALGVTAATARVPAGDRFVGRWGAMPPVPSASGMAGLSWAAPHSRRQRAQVLGVVLGVAVAVGAAVASISVVASLRHLTAEPIRYGAPWHATVSAALGPESVRAVADSLAELDGVEAVGGLTGNDGAIGDHVVYVYGVMPVPGLPGGIDPVVSRGRLPSAADEVALGATSLAEAGAEIGDTVELQYLERSYPLRVVGEVLVYDNWEDLPGVGAVVDSSLVEQVDPEAPISDYVVRFEPEATATGVAALRAEFPRLVTGPVVPGGVRNLERVSSWPALLSVMIGVLALATFVHALIVMVRRQWGQLAVLRALGFRRRQLGATVSWYASALLVPALIVGVPLGVAAGRWGWTVLAGDLGVPASPVVPLAALAIVVLGAVVVANVAAGPMTWRAGRIDAASELRAE